jgi:hypothetical protein
MNTRFPTALPFRGSVDGRTERPVSSAVPRMLTGVVTATLAVMAAACAGRTVPETVDPSVAGDAVARTAPDRPLRVVFDWRILDGEARFDGRGVARIEPPYRARLDLFGPRGEGYLSAALVGSELRLPGPTDAPLPPPALMWAVLGVVSPPETARLEGTRVEGSSVELYYTDGDRRLVYELEGGRLRLVELEGGSSRVVVELKGDGAGGLPGEAVYRDWSGYTELMMNLEQVDEVDSYPPETWDPSS